MTTGPESLEGLREELDRQDRALLETAARRHEIVRRIASAKARADSGRPLFDRTRERAVYDRARETARAIGLPVEVAHALMQTVIEHSHRAQASASRPETGAAVATQRICIVGGHGRMGRRLGAEFSARGHEIDVLELDDGRDRSAAARAADVVIVSVPMESAVAVTRHLGPSVRRDALLCDVNSLKQEVCEAMASSCRGECVGLHPMFGPTVHSLRRQKVVLCPVNRGARVTWLRRELEQIGVEIIETTPETHDRMMAVVQVLMHFSTLVMGRALASTGISVEQSLRFTSPIYRLELAFVGRLFTQNPDLYAEIEMTNPHGTEVRRAFREASSYLDDIIASGDRDTFRDTFRGVSDYFRDFGDEAMHLSDYIIDTLVKQP